MKVVIVDCQMDFCEGGALAVEGGCNAVSNICKFLERNYDEIESIHFTLDWHPATHCSFKENGGQWPTHCVQYSMGAALHPSLMKFVCQNIVSDRRYGKAIVFHTKGTKEDTEEYGAFGMLPYMGHEWKFKHFMTWDDKDVVIMGIAGDYCVLETAKNLIKAGFRLHFYLDGIASIDGGKKLNEFIAEEEKKYNLVWKEEK